MNRYSISIILSRFKNVNIKSFNLLEYVMYLLKNIMKRINVDIDDTNCNYENEIYIHMESITFESISSFASSEEYRQKLISIGVEKASEFLHPENKDSN